MAFRGVVAGAAVLALVFAAALPAGEGGPGYYHRWTAPFEFLGPGREMSEDWRLTIPTVRVGLLGSFEGGGGVYGRAMEQGARMAADEINAAGGLQGRRVELVRGDDQNDMGLNGTETVRLIDEGCWAIIGSVHSGCTHVATRITLKYEVPQLTSISTDPTIGLVGSPWMFRCLVDDRAQGRALANLVFDRLGYARVALAEHRNRYGKMGGKEIRQIAERRGTPVIFTEQFESDQTDFTSLIDRLVADRAEAIIIWGLYGPAGRLVRQMRERGVRIQVFGSDGIVAPAFLEVAGPGSEGALVTYPYDETRRDPVNQAFIERFRRRYGEMPDSFSAHGYDAMMIIASAIRRGGLNRYRIRDALANTRNFPGVTGSISFDHQGNDTREVIFARVVKGRFVPLRDGDLETLAAERRRAAAR